MERGSAFTALKLIGGGAWVILRAWVTDGLPGVGRVGKVHAEMLED